MSYGVKEFREENNVLSTYLFHVNGAHINTAKLIIILHQTKQKTFVSKHAKIYLKLAAHKT